MNKVVFECDTCGFKKVIPIEDFAGKLSDLSEPRQHTHMCDTGRVEVIEGVMMNKARFQCDVCGLDKEVEFEPLIKGEDDCAVLYSHMCDTGRVVALDPVSINGIALDGVVEEE